MKSVAKLRPQQQGARAARVMSRVVQLNSARTLAALEKLTGEGPLISDPFFRGGGLHQIERGGFLGVHADFSRPPHLQMYRRLNLLVYLNEDWQPEYGGNLELWSKDAKEKVVEISPVANALLLRPRTARPGRDRHRDPLAAEGRQ